MKDSTRQIVGSQKSFTVKAVLLRVYRLLHAKVLGVLLFIAMAILGLIGTLIMQAPMARTQDPQGYAQWIAQAREKYGFLTPIFDFLGFFNLWSSPLFLAVTVLLGLSIIACTTHRLPLLVKKTLHPRINVSTRFFSHAQYRASIASDIPATDTVLAVEEVLAGRRLRVVKPTATCLAEAEGHPRNFDSEVPPAHSPTESTAAFSLYADRHRFGPFGTVIAHASFVLILAAFAISAFTGFERTMELPIGEELAVENGTGMHVTATSFNDTYDSQGRPTDYVSHLQVSHEGKVIKAQEVRVNTPLVVNGIRFHQASFGVAATVRIKTTAGIDLGQHTLALKWTSRDGKNSVGRLDLPEQDRQIIIATPASGQRQGQVAAGTAIVEVYELSSGRQLDAAAIDQGQSETLSDLVVNFQRETVYTGIIVRRDPGTWWMWAGSALLVIGMFMTFGLKHRRFWVQILPETDGKAQVLLAAVDEPDSTLDRQFQQLAHSILERCQSKEGSSTCSK